jgi:type IV secretion system protein VirD4
MPPFVREDRPSASWMNPSKLEADRFAMKDGKILLGRTKKNEQPIGLHDNRHLVTIAGSRAGKSATSLIPNLLTWVGSTIVVDPKGELATETAKWRSEKLGQDVFILDPFNEVKGSASQYRTAYNPFDEMKFSGEESIIDDAADMADALIVSDGNGKSDHWTLSAKNMLRGLILFAYYRSQENDKPTSLAEIRDWITLPFGGGEKDDSSQLWLSSLFDIMSKSEGYEGVISGVGATMLGKPENERGSILSTAIEQTAFLDSIPMKRHLAKSGLSSIRVLKHKPTTIYLVLPASRMAYVFYMCFELCFRFLSNRQVTVFK